MKNTTIIVLLTAVVVMAVLLWRGCASDKIHNQGVLIDALTDTLRTERNEHGQEIARIKDIRITERRAFLSIDASKDKTLGKLQALVREHKRAYNALVLSTSTSVTGSHVTHVYGGDTVRTDSMVYIWPVYRTSWTEKWSSGDVRASKDSIFKHFTVFNEFELVQEWKRDKWWKKKYGEAKITNLNPHSETLEMRTYSLEAPPKRMSFGVGVYGGVSVPSLAPTVIVGCGIQYNLIGK